MRIAAPQHVFQFFFFVVTTRPAAYTRLLIRGKQTAMNKDVRTPKRWTIAPPWQGSGQAARRLAVPPLVVQLHFNRGLINTDGPLDTEAVRTFLKPA